MRRSYLKNKVGIINTVNAFCHRNRQLADKYHPMDEDANDKFLGDFFELLCEFLQKKNGGDNRIGVFDITPTEKNAPGVDFVGVGANGFPSTTQSKFRPHNYVLTEKDSLAIFPALSWGKYGVRVEDNMNMLIITTAAKVSPITLQQVLLDKVRVLAYPELRSLLDGMTEWWLEFRDAVKASRGKVETVIPLTLRPHQQESAEAAINCERGKIILPTGTGKSRIEAEIIRKTIINTIEKGEVPLIKINTSRILLCFQLFEDVYKYLTSHGVHARYANFNSGDLDDAKFVNYMRRTNGIARNVVSTTNTNAIAALYAECVKDKQPLIVTSTYHSSEKFADSNLTPHLTIHDEAHNLVSLGFSVVTSLPSESNIFLTATEENSSNSNLGMDNIELFGETIYQRSPRQMIDVGEMVLPKIHVVVPADGQKYSLTALNTDYKAILKSVYSALKEHDVILKDTSYNADNIAGKMMVTLRNQTDLIEMAKHFDDYKKIHPEIHLFALSTDFGIYCDGVRKHTTYNMDKHEMLESIRRLPSNAMALIFHVDMIGEGIDAPGITGVMMFRNSNIPKFIQNIGRASRLHPDDRKRLYNGEITVEDKSKWIKPYSWIILPNFLEDSTVFFQRYHDIVVDLRENYGFKASSDVVIDCDGGLHNPPEIPPVNEVEGEHNNGKSGLNDFKHDLEAINKQIEMMEEQIKLQKEVDDLLSSL